MYPLAGQYPMPLYRFIVISMINDGRQPSYYNTDDELYAKRVAMTWLVSGFTAWVTDLNYDVIGTDGMGKPTRAHQFFNLQGVLDLVPGVKYSYQATPPLPPEGLSDADFATWLIGLSKTTPTWPLPKDKKAPAVIHQPQPVS